MFIDELSPIFKQLSHYPASFLGGLASGLFRLNLGEDPVKSWLDQHIGGSITSSTDAANGKTSGPQQINID
jgi:hypothetical protein